MGWTSHDVTSQTGDYFHVDDFAGLGGGTYGVLNALEGDQSLWGGARASASVILCGYATLPGYGNGWNQAFCTRGCLVVGTGVVIDYLAAWDSEPGYDATAVEVDECNDNWIEIYGGVGVYDGTGAETASVAVNDSLHSGSLRIRFHFTADGGWSDEDGLWDTDGFIIIDSLTVSDVGGVVVATEDFEDPDDVVGATSTVDWESCTPPGYGDFAMLYNALFLVQEDPCAENLTCLWTFYTGSTFNYGCGGFPAQTAVPYVNARDQYISDEVWSPLIPNVGSGSVYELNFQTYRDLTLNALIFYVFHVRSWDNVGCPSAWADRNFVYFGGQKDWITSTFPFGDLVQGGAVSVQVAVGAVDMCGVWCGINGDGACHSHAPMIDNVNVIRIAAEGPQWSVRDINLFQDNFAADGTTTGTATADAAIDILPSGNPNIHPGDSTVVNCSDPDAGLAPDSYTGFGSAVYCYIAVWPQGQPGKDGGNLSQNNFRYPVVDSLVHDGTQWYCLRMDTSFTQGAARTGAQPDAWAIDLNDNLFTPGDTICFVFCAENGNAIRTYWTPFTGSTDDQWLALNNPAEFTILPAGGWLRGGDILYVDGMNARGAQPFFDTAFDFLNIRHLVDRYDIRGPSSSVANRPGARVVDVFQQIIPCYRKIIWNTGDLQNGTLGDGTGNPEKSDDAFLLFTFIDQLANTGGLYLNGDDLANEWAGLVGPFAVSLRNYIQHTVVNDDHVAAGLGIAPLGVGTGVFPVGCFNSILGADTLVTYGGCALINNFDVIAPAGPSTLEMTYEGNGLSGGAIVGQKTVNSAGFPVGVLLSGFSYHYIRDDQTPPNSMGVPDRVEHLFRVLTWLENTPVVPVDVPDRTASRNSMDQNYPNPFNPTTTIKYEVKDAGMVSLKIYNVAGQLVKTLVNENQLAGVVHTAEWNGRNDTGQFVSSGVYFYKLTAPSFTMTKKMVLLK
jgi:hypothetical protein